MIDEPESLPALGAWRTRIRGHGLGKVGRVMQVLAPAAAWQQRLRPPRIKVQWCERPTAVKDVSWVRLAHTRPATDEEVEAAGAWPMPGPKLHIPAGRNRKKESNT